MQRAMNSSQKAGSPDVMDLADSPTSASQKTLAVKSSVKTSHKRPHVMMPNTPTTPAEALEDALEHLRINTLPALPPNFTEVTTGGVLPQAQKKLLRVITFLFHVGDVISSEAAAAIKNMVEGELHKLEEEKARCTSLEKELRETRDRARGLEAESIRSSEKVVKLGEEKAKMWVQVGIMKAEIATHKEELEMASIRERMIGRWKIARDWLQDKAKDWNLEEEFQAYKGVVEADALDRGVPLPTFEDEPTLPPATYLPTLEAQGDGGDNTHGVDHSASSSAPALEE